MLFGLDCLVQAFRPAAAFHDAAGELVDDLHFAVGDHVVDVAVEQVLRLQRLLQVVGQRTRSVGVDVIDAQVGLDALETQLRGVDGALGLVHLIVHVAREAQNRAGELVVRVGRRAARTRDDQRGARLVDEDGVDLVDHGEVVPALHTRRGTRHHVVAQVVEAEL